MYDGMYLDAAFLFPVFGWRPTPLNTRFENSVMVVESII